MKSAGCGVFLHRAAIRFSVAHDGSTAIQQAGQNQTGQEIHMNVRTITSLIFAVALTAPVAGVFAGENSDICTYASPQTTSNAVTVVLAKAAEAAFGG